MTTKKILPWVVMAAVSFSCQHHNAPLERKAPAPCLYIVPLNEEFLNLPAPYLLDVQSPRQREGMKKHLRAAFAQSDGLPTTSQVAHLLASATLSSAEHTQLAEWYVYTKYGLVPNGTHARVTPINLLPCLGELVNANMVQFVFPHSYLTSLTSKLVVKGTTDKYLLVGSDLIRMAEPEFRGCSREVDTFFEKYSAWPYMVVVDTATYHTLRNYLTRGAN